MDRNNTTLYFSYASNMSSKRILQSCPGAKFQCVAKLEDHQFYFMGHKDEWAGAVANAVPQKGKRIWGVVWEIPSTDMTSLGGTESKAGDKYEHVAQICEVINQEAKPLKCVYFYRDPKSCSVSLPSPQYLQLILNGAEEHRIDQNYLGTLRKTETNSNTVITDGMRKALY